MASKKASLEAATDQTPSRRNRAKTVRRSLVEASEAQKEALLARELRTSQTQRELAVLVVVEFTGEIRKRKQLTAVARLARSAAAVMAGEEDLAGDAASNLDSDASRAEFEELARSAGATIASTLVQRRQKPDPSSLVGHGKLDELVEVVTSTNASLVLVDHDLSPSQLRNIEARLPCHVIDRSQLILDIFGRHAKTREGPSRSNWHSSNTSCLVSPDVVAPCRSLAAASEPAVRAKPSSRPIAERSISALP